MSLSSHSSPNSENISIKKSSFNAIIIGAIIAITIAAFSCGYVVGNSSPQANSGNSVNSDLDKRLASLEEELATVKETSKNSPTPLQQTQPAEPVTTLKSISFEDEPMKGDPNAPITIVEFSDFQCPFCGRWYANTLSDVEKNYIDTGLVKFVYRDFPLTSIHSYAFDAHVAAECADEQNKFLEYHNMLFEKQSEWTKVVKSDLPSKLIEYASLIKLNTTDFETCLSSQKIADEINTDSSQARSYGATGTPTFFIGNEGEGYVKLSGAQSFASFQKIIDEKLS